MTARILIAEDEPRQAKVLQLYLEREGHSVVVAPDGLTALEEIRRRRPDLVLLDVMMPHLDGLDVCRVIRSESDVPIIMVTARSTEEDLLAGLNLGADDYISKPYKPRELVARVRAMLRRHQRAAPEEVIQHNGLEMNSLRRQVTVDGHPVELTAREFDLLATLAAEPGRVFTRAQLLERAFGFDYQGLDRTADAHIRTLRRKLADDPNTPRFIETVYGVGYRLIDVQ
ncbi:MAG: response regulator [Acidimicrobiia bacterium]